MGKIDRFWSEILLILILHSEEKKIHQKGRAEIQLLNLTALNEKSSSSSWVSLATYKLFQVT